MRRMVTSYSWAALRRLGESGTFCAISVKAFWVGSCATAASTDPLISVMISSVATQQRRCPARRSRPSFALGKISHIATPRCTAGVRSRPVHRLCRSPATGRVFTNRRANMRACVPSQQPSSLPQPPPSLSQDPSQSQRSPTHQRRPSPRASQNRQAHCVSSTNKPKRYATPKTKSSWHGTKPVSKATQDQLALPDP